MPKMKFTRIFLLNGLLFSLFITLTIGLVNANNGQTPFHGSPAPIPGIIEAEDFDRGGEGVAYHDTDSENHGGKYRVNEGVDLEDCSEGGFNVGWIQPGEWTEYTVRVQTTAQYTFEVRVASLSTGGTFHIEFNNKNVTGQKQFSHTDGWQNWITVSIPNVYLTAGEQVMKLVAESSGFNVNSIKIICQAVLTPPKVSITTPADKAKFTRGDDILIAANATDSDGHVVKVEFYADGDKIGEDTSQPYNMVWRNVPIGKYDLTAVAIDNDGVRATSKKVDISVKYPQFEHQLTFSEARGFYNQNFNLKISTDVVGASIKYTLDGSNPLTSPSARTKSASTSLTINPDSRIGRGKTPGVVVRAVALKDGAQQTNVETHTYLFIEKVKNQFHPGGDWPDSGVNGQRWHYEMNQEVVQNSRYRNLIDDALLDIPTISLVMDLDNLFDPEIGIYVNAPYHGKEWERPTSVELINPDGSLGFQIDAGLRIRGGWSRHGSYPKHAFRLFFREEYGKSKLEFPLFENEGVDEFVKMDLRTSQNYAWSNGYVSENTMNRDVFSRDVQREMQQPYTRSRYYHLYLNGLYWGLFQTQERPEANFAESYLGGNDADYDVVKVDIGEEFNLYDIEATDGNLDAWREVWEACQIGFSSNANYFKLEGCQPDGTKDPNGKKLVDIDNLIDYMLIIFYTGNFDAPVSKFSGNRNPNNFYAIYNRNRNDGFKFFAHDCEHTLLMHDIGPGEGILENRVNIADISNRQMQVSRFEKFHPQWLHHKLTANKEYRQRFADHVYRHFFNNGVLMENSVIELFMARANEIDLAIIAESARWGDMQRSKNRAWQPTIDEIVEDYFPQRGEIVLDQLVTASLYSTIKPPIFKMNGKEILDEALEISGNFNLELVNPSGTRGSIKYTLDGSDPRKIGGAVAANAQDAGDNKTIRISQTCQLKARIFYNNQWSALHEIDLAANENLNALKLTEIHYHPLDEGEVSGKEYEFVELKNTGSATLNLSLAAFIKGIHYTFPSGTSLEAGEFLVLASNLALFQQRYGFASFDEFEGQLDNNGEKLVLVTAGGDTIVTVRYYDESPWPVYPDKYGHSLVCKGHNAAGDQNQYVNWRHSHAIHGSPGRDDQASSVASISSKRPTEFELQQNFPNPFNSTTTIRFAIKSETDAKLVIFDLLGRTVATLVDKKLTAGQYSVAWDAHSCAGGIYFYHLQTAEGFQATKKMVLIK